MKRREVETLSLPEQILLLLVDEQGRPRVGMTGALAYALFSAALLELCERRCVRFEGDKVVPGSITDAQDGFLDAILHELRKTTQAQEVWLVVFGLLQRIPQPREWILAQLVRKLERAGGPLEPRVDRFRLIATLLRAAGIDRAVFTPEQAEAAARDAEQAKDGPELAGTLDRVRTQRDEEVVRAALLRAMQSAG